MRRPWVFQYPEETLIGASERAAYYWDELWHPVATLLDAPLDDLSQWCYRHPIIQVITLIALALATLIVLLASHIQFQ